MVLRNELPSGATALALLLAPALEQHGDKLEALARELRRLSPAE